MQTKSHRVIRTLPVVAAAGVLGWAGPRPDDLPPAHGLASWFASTPLDKSVTLLAGVLAEACVLYLLTCVTLVALGRLPGLTGRVAGAMAARVAPALVRRALESALGLTVATASVAGAMPAVAAGPVPRTQTAGVLGTAAMGWAALTSPLSSAWSTTLAPSAALPSPSPTPSPPPLPSLDRPGASPEATPSEAAPPLNPPPPHPVAPTPVATRSPAAHEVVVQRGDSLWRIAARHLGPEASDAQVAAAWPRWYAANRPVIGPNPDLLLPGQRLHPPS